MKWTFDDGGRRAAGWEGLPGDCVCRSIAIAAELPYQRVYDKLNEMAKTERPRRKGRYAGQRSSARTGVFKPTWKKLLKELGFVCTPTMGIGTGCRVHLRDGELPMGRLIVQTSRHLTAVIDGVVHDTHDPSRDGTRCVYGYWVKP
jgi:hypothetical protein